MVDPEESLEQAYQREHEAAERQWEAMQGFIGGMLADWEQINEAWLRGEGP